MAKDFYNQSKWRKNLPLAALGLLVLMILTFLVLLQSSSIWRWFPAVTASDTLILYALTSLNFFALVIFGFIFLRSVIKLFRERRSSKLGSKLKTRLLVYFVAVSLLPIAAMATFSYLFLNRALEKWFSRLPETVIAEARDVQKRAIEKGVQNFDEKTALLAAIIESETELDEQNLRRALEIGQFAALEIAAQNGVVLARIERDIFNEHPNERQETLHKLRTNPNADNSLRDGIGFDAAILVLADGRTLRAVSTWRDEKSVSFAISNSPQEFERLKEQQTEVRQLGFSTLSLLTFLLIFAASWVAFHLGRSLTAPIYALAEASNEVARGNFKHRIEVVAEDELRLLVESFNQMATQLDENRFRLDERRRYIETVLQSLSSGVISLDEQNRITTINDRAQTMLRLENADFENRLLSEVVGAEDLAVLEKLLTRARRLGNAAEQTVLLREANYKSDSEFANANGLPVALTATALRGSYGKNFGAVLVIEDLSELLSAQRAAAWQEVARRMAHEIKNPLTPIQLAAERIHRNFHKLGNGNQSNGSSRSNQPTTGETQLSKVVNQSTDTILQEVSSLKLMVDEFSQFARLPHAKLEIGDLNEIISQTVKLYEDRLTDAQIEIDLADNLPDAMLDHEQLRRVFVNLIDNALESFEQNASDKKITVQTFHDSEKDLIVAEISDTGRGIANSDYAKLFQPYFSTKGRGTGLGLAIVQRIISEHGGRIRAVSNQPRGAKFVVELPIANA